MNIVVPIKQIPNLIDELEINSEGTHLDHDALQYVLNEFDEHALEEAVLTKESAGGTVTVIGVDTTGELNEALHTALAKGADKAVKITGDFPRGTASHTQAKLLADAIKGLSPDLVFTGVQAADDREGQVGVLLGAMLGSGFLQHNIGARFTLDQTTAAHEAQEKCRIPDRKSKRIFGNFPFTGPGIR